MTKTAADVGLETRGTGKSAAECRGEKAKGREKKKGRKKGKEMKGRGGGVKRSVGREGDGWGYMGGRCVKEWAWGSWMKEIIITETEGKRSSEN